MTPESGEPLRSGGPRLVADNRGLAAANIGKSFRKGANNALAAQITSGQRQAAETPRELPDGMKVLRAVRPVIGPQTRPLRRGYQHVRWFVRSMRQAERT